MSMSLIQGRLFVAFLCDVSTRLQNVTHSD